MPGITQSGIAPFQLHPRGIMTGPLNIFAQAQTWLPIPKPDLISSQMTVQIESSEIPFEHIILVPGGCARGLHLSPVIVPKLFCTSNSPTGFGFGFGLSKKNLPPEPTKLAKFLV